jgi:periplasmic copper chaperone A
MSSLSLSLAVLVLPPDAAKAQTPTTIKAGSLVITTPWLRETPTGARVAGGYLTITNTGTETDRLTGGAVGFAGRVEVHEMTMTDGVMRMRELADGLEIKPGQTVELKPGGLHIMFMDLKAPMKIGGDGRGQLTFQRAGTVAVDFQIAPAGARNTGSPHKH